MEEIYQKAKSGGYNIERIGHQKYVLEVDRAMLFDAEFWKCLYKACGWGENVGMYMHHIQKGNGWEMIPDWQFYALRFHEINLTQGFDAAVAYLSGVVKA